MITSNAKIAVAALFVAASAFAGAATAQNPGDLSDVAYIAAARCEGLAQGAKVDTSAIKKMLVNQEGARSQAILDKADEVRQDARRQASRAQGFMLQSVNAELSGACQTYLKS
jgi:hypothetical protein